jgi:uncharacterized repeat protein (TIGR01451 family)
VKINFKKDNLYNRNKYRYLPKKIKSVTDLTLEASTCKCMVCPGDEIPYIINVVNKGPIIAKNIIVTDLFEDKLKISSIKALIGSMQILNNQVIWKIPKLEVGQKAIAMIVVISTKEAYKKEDKYIINTLKLTCDNKLKHQKNRIATTITYINCYDNSITPKGYNTDYYVNKDIYNFKSSKTLTILPNFQTYQQTTDYTCGPACAHMVLQHFKSYEYTELQIAKMMNTHNKLGTSTDKMVKFFESIGWKVTSSITEGKLDDGYTFSNPIEFREWVISNLKDNTPIMVEWVDWNGHWQIIIGYDTIDNKLSDNEGLRDDVIILADPDDTTDHMQDGYYIYSAERFFYMWLDNDKLPKEQKNQQWVIAKPKSENKKI